tara:strand:+ start:341 stop:457 length:117 start_codon:yes stop_codon:yes gene_type:complete
LCTLHIAKALKRRRGFMLYLPSFNFMGFFSLTKGEEND